MKLNKAWHIIKILVIKYFFCAAVISSKVQLFIVVIGLNISNILT